MYTVESNQSWVYTCEFTYHYNVSVAPNNTYDILQSFADMHRAPKDLTHPIHAFQLRLTMATLCLLVLALII